MSSWGKKELMRFHDAVITGKIETAKGLLDTCLDPDATIPVGTFDDSQCDGFTLLYMACVYDKMDIVKILLEAGANPDECNDFGNDCLIRQSPFYYAIRTENIALVRMLLRYSKVHVKGTLFAYEQPLPYGMFRQFHDDEDVIKVIMDAGDDASEYAIAPYYPRLRKLLQTAAKHNCANLFTYVMEYFGAHHALIAILGNARFGLCDSEKDAISYLIDIYGGSNFVNDITLMHIIMERACCLGITEMLFDHFYQVVGDNKNWWRHQMMFGWTPKLYTPRISYMHYCIKQSFYPFKSLLRWGIYSAVRDFSHASYTVFFALVEALEFTDADMFASLFPQCLQDKWLVDGYTPWTITKNFKSIVSAHAEAHYVSESFQSLIEKRRYVPHLKVLCRSVIFHELGIKPIPKAERLPLPRNLKDFVQCKDLFD